MYFKYQSVKIVTMGTRGNTRMTLMGLLLQARCSKNCAKMLPFFPLYLSMTSFGKLNVFPIV